MGRTIDETPLEADSYEETMGVSIHDIIMLTARLAQLLAEEADLLAAMKIKHIEPLQREKIILTQALEKQRKYIEQNPWILHGISTEEREDLRAVSEVFDTVLHENHRRLLIAKEINQKMVEAIADVAKEAAGRRQYDPHGVKDAPRSDAVSLTLNKMV